MQSTVKGVLNMKEVNYTW